MAIKTISLELDAYEKLKRAKRGRESFSSVVRRASFDDTSEAREVLTRLRDLHRLHPESFLSDEELERIDERTRRRDRRPRPQVAEG